jgi:hypothetical protein
MGHGYFAVLSRGVLVEWRPHTPSDENQTDEEEALPVWDENVGVRNPVISDMIERLALASLEADRDYTAHYEEQDEPTSVFFTPVKYIMVDVNLGDKCKVFPSNVIGELADVDLLHRIAEVTGGKICTMLYTYQGN